MNKSNSEQEYTSVSIISYKNFGCAPRNEVIGSYDNYISNVLRNPKMDFQSGFLFLHSHQEHEKISGLAFPLQHLLSLVFLVKTILNWMRKNGQVTLICISLVSKNVDHFFFSHFLGICIFCFWEFSVHFHRLVWLAYLLW